MRVLKWFAIVGFIFLVTGFIVGYVAYQKILTELPDVKVLQNIQYHQPLNIYSAEGLLIEQFGEKIRTPISIEETPKLLINAFIASEDGNFFEHSGVDYKAIARAVIQLILTGKKKQGGSTITMQVTRNFLLTKEKTYIRKIKEIILSFQIENTYSKNEILEMYMNKIYLGKRAYGVVSAANIYYNRSLDELTLAEICMIAGLPKAPSSYNPISNPNRAILRRNYVLKRMLVLDYIRQNEFDEAVKAPVTAHRFRTQRELYAPYIAEMVRNEMISRYGKKAAYTRGFKVYTTLKADLQHKAVEALRTNLHHYDERHSYRMTKEHLMPLKELSNIGSTLVATVVSVDKQRLVARLKKGELLTLDWKKSVWRTLYNSKTKKTKKIRSYAGLVKAGYSIRVRQEEGQWHLAQIPKAESAFVAMNPKNGAIWSLSGGYAYFTNKYNRAIQAKRQPGSGFKPIIYSTALEQGYTAASLINDAPIMTTSNALTENEWRPENYSHKFYGPTSIRTALRKSRNLISIRLLRAVGILKAIEMGTRFGFKREQLPDRLSLALGSGYASPLQMARMYSVFANGGFLVKPYFIERIELPNGDIIFQAEPEQACPECALLSDVKVAPRILSEEVTFLMNTLLQDVVRRGTAVKAKVLKRNDLAGKTGTTNKQKDAWFNGFTPYIVGNVWVGHDDSQSLGRVETGGKAALPMWIDFMRYALQVYPEQKLVMPTGIVQRRIDSESSLLAHKNTKGSYWEYFRKDYAPVDYMPVTIPQGDTMELDGVSEMLF